MKITKSSSENISNALTIPNGLQELIVKKSCAFSNACVTEEEETKISTVQRFELIHQIIEKYQLKRMVRYLCGIANVSRSGYYRYF